MSSSLKRPASPSTESARPSKIVKDAEPILDLSTLLDVSELSSQVEIHARFEKLATALLHDYYFCVHTGGNDGVEHAFELLEIEFYLRTPTHADPFAHGTLEQSESGKWYFHRAPGRSGDSGVSVTTTGYRGGTRKGLDLTFGAPLKVGSTHFSSSVSPEKPVDIRGGILLRSIRSTGNQAVVSGPSLLVDQVLALSGSQSIKELVQEKWANDTTAFKTATCPSMKPSLYLKKRNDTNAAKPLVYSSPRIGLDLSHPGTEATPSHPRPKFVCMRYRYFVRPELLVKNGRAQTFLGAFFAAQETLGREATETKIINAIMRIMNVKEDFVRRNLADYNAGLSDGNLVVFVGPRGKGVGASPSKFLRMIGVLAGLSAQSLQEPSS